MEKENLKNQGEKKEGMCQKCGEEPVFMNGLCVYCYEEEVYEKERSEEPNHSGMVIHGSSKGEDATRRDRGRAMSKILKVEKKRKK